MAASPTKTSRYRKLRGKSVCEPRRATVHLFNEQPDSSLFTLRSALTSQVWKRQSKVQEVDDKALVSEVDPHYPLPPIPKPPIQKQHSSATRPRAAVLPSGPAFGEPVTPTPLRTRHSTQALTSVHHSPPEIREKLVARSSEDSKPKKEESIEKQEKLDSAGHGGHVGHLVVADHPALLADRLEAETDKLLAEQKRLEIARLHKQLIATESRVSVSSSSTLRTPSKSPVFERFGFLNRGRRSQATISPTSSTTTFVDLASRSHSTEASMSPITPWESKLQMTPPTSPLSPFPLGRFVTIRYRSEQFKIRITGDTDTVDVLRQASEQMKLPVAPAASNLHECCSRYGIERRLRRYERIQEVLESWPQNSQHSLIIRHACGLYNDRDLDISFVPLNRMPATVTLQLHHCLRPGKWQKRWVTLLCDGQVLLSKKASHSPAEKDCQMLCDLSSYDIYTPMDEPAILLDEGRSSSRSPRASPVKSLKPPKRWVFAIRSQERPTTFAESANYAHFFCTDDPAVANKFQTAVHFWRSWYIIKMRGDMQRKFDADVEIASPTRITPVEEKRMRRLSPVKMSPKHVLKISLGDNKPLMNLELEIDEFRKKWVPELPLILPPTTPGSRSNAFLMTPSTGDGAKDGLDQSSPSEQRRKRRDMKRSLALHNAGEQPSDDDDECPATATIIINEPKAAPETPIRSSDSSAANITPAKPEPSPWLPSAAEHTARLRAEQARLERTNIPATTPQRPATSAGVMRGGREALHATMQPSMPANMDRRALIRVNTTHDIGIHQPQPQAPLSHVTNYMDWAEPQPPLPTGLSGPGSGIHFSLTTSRGTSRHLEVPSSGGKRRQLTSMPSMPALIESGSPRKQRSASGVPTVWTEGSKTSKDRHKNSNSVGSNSGRPSTSSGARPSTSGGGSSSGGAVGLRQLNRGRSGSLTSLRRGAGPRPVEAPPPIPPLPLHVRPALRDGTGPRPLGMMITDARIKSTGNK